MTEADGALRTSLQRVLEAFGVAPEARLGRGGEASVYALDAERVLRVQHAGADPASAAGRAALLSELARSARRVPFAIPTVLERAEVAGRLVSVERRLPGRALSELLSEATGAGRGALVRAYLEAAARIGDLALERPSFGDLLLRGPLRTQRFRAYLRGRAARNLRVAGPAFASVDAERLAAELPEPAKGELVHLDAFPGNFLAQGATVTAVIDFGSVAIVGDRRLDPPSVNAQKRPYMNT